MKALAIGTLLATLFGSFVEPVTSWEVSVDTEEDIEEEMFYDSLEMVAACVEAEAGNQDMYGKRLVVDVIFNRVDDPRFPNTIEGVISQKGQFSVYPYAMYAVEPSEETYEAVRMELDERSDDEILFFSAGGYLSCCTPAYKYGDHYFGR